MPLSRASLFLIVCVLLLALGVLPAAAQGAPEAPPPTDDAVTMNDLRARGLFVRGLTQARLDNHAGAIEAFESALELAGEDGAVLLALAESHRALDANAEALFYATQATEALPDAAEPRALLAELHRAAGRTVEAVAAYELLLERHPDREEAWAALADLHAEAGHAEAAVETYRQFWQRAAHPRAAGLRLVRLLDAAGRPDEAVIVVEMLAETDPDAYALRLDLARRYADLGHSDAAIRLLTEMQAARPNDGQITLLLARVYQESDRADEAADLFRSVADSSDPEVLFGRAATLFNRAQSDPTVVDDAVAALTEIVERDPRPDALQMLATLRYDAGAYAEAAALFDRAVQAEPRVPDWWVQALDAALRAGDAALAARLADDALLLYPGQPPLLDAAAEAYVRAERYREAAAALRSLEAPTAAQLERLGDAERASGDEDAARAAWERALELEPDRASLLEKLGRTP